MTQPPANWYPDPQQPARLRYWDGTQWTEHVSTAQMPAPTVVAPEPKKGMSGLAVAGIVAGVVVALLVVVGIIAAIAIPVFLNQKDKAANTAARTSVRNTAIAIETYLVDFPNTVPLMTTTVNGVTVATPDGQVVQDVTLEDGVSFGGLVTENNGAWCVWVTGGGSSASWSSPGGLNDGPCP